MTAKVIEHYGLRIKVELPLEIQHARPDVQIQLHNAWQLGVQAALKAVRAGHGARLEAELLKGDIDDFKWR